MDSTFYQLSRNLRDALVRCSQVGWPVDVQQAFYAWQTALNDVERADFNRAIIGPMRGISPEEDRMIDALEAEALADDA
jgi:hypothetical protein